MNNEYEKRDPEIGSATESNREACSVEGCVVASASEQPAEERDLNEIGEEELDGSSAEGLKMDLSTADRSVEHVTFNEIDEAFREKCIVKREKRNFSRLGFCLAVYTFLFFLIASIGAYAVNRISPQFYESDFFKNLLPPVALYLFSLPILLILFSGIRTEVPEKKKMSLGAWMACLLICLGLMQIGARISTVVMGILTALFGLEGQVVEDMIMDGPGFAMYFVYSVIIAPIGEELVFRKLLIDRTKQYGCLISALLSGLTFGFMHGNLNQLFFAFGVGLVLAYIYYTTGNVWYTVAIHAAVNLISGVLSYLLSVKLYPLLEAFNSVSLEPDEILEIVENVSILEYAPVLFGMMLMSQLMLTAVACAIALPIALKKHIVLEKGSVCLPRGKRFSIIFLNAGVIVMFLVYFAEIVMNLFAN